MKIYLAAKFSRRAEMEELAGHLPWVGHECIARWVYGGEEGLTLAEIARLDLDDVDVADALVLFTHTKGEPQPGGGRFVEFGYALAKGKRCVVIGDRENVFMNTEGVEVYEDWKTFIDHENGYGT